MKRELHTHYSERLARNMNILTHGHAGTPLIAVPCQDGMCDKWESCHLQEALSE